MAYKYKNEGDLLGSMMPKFKKPLDVRTVADSFAELQSAPATYMYPGMTVACLAEKAVYICEGLKSAETTPATGADYNWKKVAGGLEGADLETFNKGFIHNIDTPTHSADKVSIGFDESDRVNNDWSEESSEIVINAATTSTAGVMSAADKQKIDSAIEVADGKTNVVGDAVKIKGGTDQQVLLGDGSTASILTAAEIDALLD